MWPRWEGLTIGVGITLVGSIAKLGFFGFALFRLDWRLALLSLTVVPAFWIIGQRFARRLKAVSRERRRRAGGLTSVAEESLAVTSLVQIHGREAEGGRPIRPRGPARYWPTSSARPGCPPRSR